MSHEGNRIEIFRGDSYDAEVTVYDENNNAKNLSGAEIIFTVKQTLDGVAKITKKNAAAGGGSSQIEDSDLTNGKFKVHIGYADTNLEPGEYTYDFQVTLSTKRYTVIRDRLFIKADVTT